MSMHDFISDCAKFGLEGTELTSYYFPKDVTPDYLASLKKHCFTLGLDVSGTAVGNDFGHGADDPKRATQIQHVKTWVDHAAAMSAPVIRIFAGHHKQGRDEVVSHKLMVSAIEECCDYAGSKGVFLALENHGGPTATAKGLLQFINDVQSPWFTVNLDTGNFASDNCYDEIEQIAPYAMNVQVKVVTRNSARESQPADFNRLAKILKDAAYRGYIVLEYEEKQDPRTQSPIYIEKLKAAFLG
jgi:sugar phosphate isomerase/epimerase